MKTPSQPKMVSVIIPARDEESSIGALIPKIKESLSGVTHEIIVVDDGSTDRTGAVAQNNGTIVISHEKNLGKGAAMKTGAKNAKGDILVFLDSDGAHDPGDIPFVIAPIIEGRSDLVNGSRDLPGSRVSVPPLRRRLSNQLASITISVIISMFLHLATMFRWSSNWVKITDCTSGFRAISGEAWQRLTLDSQGFQIETEMIYEVAKNKLRIVEVPISCNWDSENSHLSIVRDGLATLKLLAPKIVKRYWRRMSAIKV
jgi:glycosyltransferase involved in cell wall biosynthesis